MKIFPILVLSLFISFPLLSQNDPYGQPVLSKQEERQFVKEKKLAEKKAEEERMQSLMVELINNQRFVLEADYIAGRSGARKPVSSLLNFIIVDSLEATLQIGSNYGIGYNGVGGITVDGDITRFEISEKTNKRGTNYSITMYINSTLGSYDVQMWIGSYGNVQATVRGNYSGSLTYSGRIVPLNESRVYKGSSL